MVRWIVVLGFVAFLAGVYCCRRCVGSIVLPFVRRLSDDQIIWLEIGLVAVVPALLIGGILAAFRLLRRRDERRGFDV